MATISQALAIAIQHHQAGRLQAAEQIYRQILAAEPKQADAWHLLGVINAQTGNHQLAVEYIYRALSVKPDFALAHNNLGNELKAQGKLDEAIACYRRALELKPDLVLAHNNLGNALKDQGELDEAVACYRRALELKPDMAEAHSNLGDALNHQGKPDEALACFRRALELMPDFALAHWNQSLLFLMTGDFQRGWAEYQWRWKANKVPRRDFSQTSWDGRRLAEKTILLHAEQGLGDTIQFIRYAALVKQRCAAVIVQCPRPLVSLLTTCAGIDRLVGEGEQLPPFNVQAPLLSLPGIFHTTLRDIPATTPYLFADPSLVDRWRRELGRLAGFKIGIAWQGDPQHVNDRNRSIPLGRFEPLARCAGVRLLSLQKGAGVEQLEQTAERLPITDLGSRLDDFMQTAAVLVNLDLVITCDTAVAHLAGALGIPVWVAIPFAPDWRWLLDRSDSPWYPTMRLFRQDRRGDWQGVFQRIEAAIGEQVGRLATRQADGGPRSLC